MCPSSSSIKLKLCGVGVHDVLLTAGLSSIYQPFFVELEWEECFQGAHDGVDGEVEEEQAVAEGEAGAVHEVEPPGDHGGQHHPAVAARLRQGHHHILSGGHFYSFL